MASGSQWRGSIAFLALSLFVGTLQSCRGEPTGVPPADLAPPIAEARGGKPVGGAAALTVSAVDPDTVTTDTVLTVRVLGSGFTEGSDVSWELAGTLTEAVKTKPPVVFISSNELHAEIAVRRDAPLARYDAVVTIMGGKKGIGVEMLEVVSKPILLPSPEWAVTSTATDVNDSGVIVGYAGGRNEATRPVRWTPQGSGWVVEELSFGEPSEVSAILDLIINDEGYVVLCRLDGYGHRRCQVRSPGGAVVELPVAPVEGMNDRGTIVGYDQRTSQWVALRRLSAESWTEPIPLSPPQGFSLWGVMAVNDEDEIAGGIQDPSGGAWPTVWRREGDGWSEAILVDAEPGVVRVINDRGAMAGEGQWCEGRSCARRHIFWPGVQAPRAVLPTGDDPDKNVLPLYDMNNADLIVGTASFKVGKKGGNVRHAVVWRPGFDTPKDLGAYRHNQNSVAHGINNAWPALVVGRTVDINWVERATAWIVF